MIYKYMYTFNYTFIMKHMCISRIMYPVVGFFFYQHTSCSDISWTHCIPVSTGFLSMKLSASEGSGVMSTCNSACLSEKLHCLPNSWRFFVYTYTISMVRSFCFCQCPLLSIFSKSL